MELMTAMTSRYSCRAYTDQPVSDQDITKVLQAANCAPVAMGQYENVALSVIRSKDIFARLEENARAVSPQMPNPHPLYGAPVLIAIHARQGEGMLNDLTFANASCLAQNMLLAATELGLGSVYLMGVTAAARQNPTLCADMGAPEGFAPYVMVALGHPADSREPKALVTDRFSLSFVD